jgi:hypothetical protein
LGHLGAARDDEGEGSGRGEASVSASSLSKVERLNIAGYSAPRLRAGRSRPVKVVDAEGNVVREITSIELAEKVHARAGIEFEAQDGVKSDADAALYAAKVAVTRVKRNGAGRYAPPEKIAEARRMREEGASLREIAKATGLSKPTVMEYVPRLSRSEGLKRHHERRKAEGRPILPPWQKDSR